MPECFSGGSCLFLRKLGIEGKHLLCMQGPFSREMNIALIHQFDIAWMVSKESGRAGGFWKNIRRQKKPAAG